MKKISDDICSSSLCEDILEFFWVLKRWNQVIFSRVASNDNSSRFMMFVKMRSSWLGKLRGFQNVGAFFKHQIGSSLYVSHGSFEKAGLLCFVSIYLFLSLPFSCPFGHFSHHRVLADFQCDPPHDPIKMTRYALMPFYLVLLSTWSYSQYAELMTDTSESGEEEKEATSTTRIQSSEEDRFVPYLDPHRYQNNDSSLFAGGGWKQEDNGATDFGWWLLFLLIFSFFYSKSFIQNFRSLFTQLLENEREEEKLEG